MINYSFIRWLEYSNIEIIVNAHPYYRGVLLHASTQESTVQWQFTTDQIKIYFQIFMHMLKAHLNSRQFIALQLNFWSNIYICTILQIMFNIILFNCKSSASNMCRTLCLCDTVWWVHVFNYASDYRYLRCHLAILVWLFH